MVTFISERETLERLVRLETKAEAKFDSLDKALVLARELIEREKSQAKADLDHRLEGMNQFQKRMDRLEGTFATKDEISLLQKVVGTFATKDELTALWRIAWIGIGVMLTLQIVFKFI